MKMYMSVFRLRLNNGLQYRAAAFAGVATQFFWGFMIIMVYHAFYNQDVVNTTMSLPQLVTYIWLQQAFLSFIMLWFRDNELFQLVTTGNIAYELCRPSSIYPFWFAKLLAQRLASAALRCLPILAIALFLPASYRLSLPSDPATAGLFVATLLLGLLVLVAISMFIYISVFITMSPVGSLLLFSVLGEFFAGSIIPIPFMPDWLQNIVYWLPFHLAADLPFRVYSGHIPASGALTGILTQIVWLTVLITVGSWAMRRVLKRVVVQGG